MGDLTRRPQRELAHGGVRIGQHRTRLDGGRELSLDDVAFGHHDGRFGENLVDVAIGEDPRVALVRPELVMDGGRALLQRLLHVHDHGQRVVIDLDGLGCVLGRRP